MHSPELIGTCPEGLTRFVYEKAGELGSPAFLHLLEIDEGKRPQAKGFFRGEKLTNLMEMWMILNGNIMEIIKK